jgi:predicted acetyltransferase
VESLVAGRNTMPAETLTTDQTVVHPRRVKKPARSIPEIRAAQRDEIDQVLLVRSEAFGLPREAWPAADALTDRDLEQVRVLVCGKRVVSCLEIKAAEVIIGDAVLPMGGVCNVATLPSERNKGHASSLMRDTLRTLRSQSLCTSILFPFSFRYYRKFGYELAGNHCQFWCRPHNLPAFSEHRWCRPATREDVADLVRIYTEVSRRRSCALVRSEARWLEILNSDLFQIVVYDRVDPAGYLIVRDGLDHYGGKLLAVEELSAESSEARRGMIGYLARYTGEAIEWCASSADLTESGVMRSVAPLREGFKPRGIATVRPMFQFRVVDLLMALRARAPVYSEVTGELSLQIRDDHVPENQAPMAISAVDGTVQILAGQRTERWLEADIRAFSQLYCGYVTPAEAVSQGLVQASHPEAVSVAEDFFPPLEPFIPMMDRF